MMVPVDDYNDDDDVVFLAASKRVEVHPVVPDVLSHTELKIFPPG